MTPRNVSDETWHAETERPPLTPPSRRFPRPKDASIMGDNRKVVEYAQMAIEEMAIDAIYARRNGTIGVEISIKDGILGKVKRTQIDFQ
jgi:hypothetical protein